MRKFLTIVACIMTLSLAGCTYEFDRPSADDIISTASASATSRSLTSPEPLRVETVPIVRDGIVSSPPLPASGACSFEEAVKWPVTGIIYLGPTYSVPPLKTDRGRIHYENGVTVSVSKDSYLRLKSLTPEVADTPAMIFGITRESFDSLMQNNAGLKYVAMQYNLYASSAFFVTSYECIPLGGIK